MIVPAAKATIKHMLRALPREDRDLFIAASNVHPLTFDNVSGLKTRIMLSLPSACPHAQMIALMLGRIHAQGP